MKTEAGDVRRGPGRLNARLLPRPKSLTQRKLRPGLPPTVAQRQAKPRRAAAAPVEATDVNVAAPVPQSSLTKTANALLLRGECWEVRYGGRTAILEDCRGLRYIALLIEQARAQKGPIHAKELVALATGQPGGPIELERRDPVLDAAARRELMSRLEEIGAERDRACAVEDFERAATLDAEHERIADELSRAAAPRKARKGGTFSDAGEKARKAVGKAITEAIARVASVPELAPFAQHLASTLHKGQWLSYTGSVDWEIVANP